MILPSKLTSSITALTLFGLCLAHPGEHHDHEEVAHSIRRREALAQHTRRSLDQCTQSSQHQALTERGIARRAAHVNSLRKKRGIEAMPQKYRRDLATLQEFEEGETCCNFLKCVAPPLIMPQSTTT